MRIRYALTKAEIVRGVFLGLTRSPRLLTIVLLGTFWPGLLYLAMNGAFSRGLTAGDIKVALEITVAVLIFLPLWIFVRGKTAERTLDVSEDGISTRIGSLSGQVPWAKVKTVSDAGSYVLVIGSSGNAFFIPGRAFSVPDQKAEFLAKINAWRSSSNG
jgi:YcxB-like protein